MKKHLFIIPLIIFATGCVLTRSARFAKCDFNYDEVVELKANGINVLGKDELSDFSTAESFSLSKAFAQRSLKVDLQMNVEVVNENPKKAVLNTVDWILQVKNKEVLLGTTSQRIEVLGDGGKATLPLKASFDIFKVLSDYSYSEITSILWAISDNPNNPNVFTFKLKPSFQMAGKQVKYPGYININY